MYKRMRKAAQFLAVTVLAGGLFMNSIQVQAATVKDLDKSSAYARAAVEWMVGNNIITGDTNGYFNPGKAISRAELATLIVKALGVDTSNLPSKATFKDVPVSHWAFRYVEAASRAGIVSGTGNGNFGVNDMCTREQVTMMLLNYLLVAKEAILADQGLKDLEKYTDEDKMSDWAKPAIQFAVANNLMSGIKTDVFSPAGIPTKEQIATILYKFKMSENTVRQKADELKKPVITFNGDIIKPSAAPEILNGEIMAPAGIFSLTGANVNTDAQTGNIVIKNSANAGRNIYMSAGDKTAYVNYAGSGNPYSDPAAQGNKITLANAPQTKGSDVMVPVKAVADALGLELDWNTKTNLAALKDSSAVKNPILYNALKNMLNFKGEYSSSMDMSMKESITGEEFGFSYTMNGVINGADSTSKSKVTTSIPGYPDESMDYETVNVGGKLYSKDPETGEWSIITEEDAAIYGIPYYDDAANREEIQNTLDLYGRINVIPEGKAILNGEEVLKYRLKMSTDILNEFIPADLADYGMNLEDIYNNGLSYKYEVYINKQGQLVKQFIKLTAGMKDTDYNVTITATSESMFSKIGQDIEIKKPM